MSKPLRAIATTVVSIAGLIIVTHFLLISLAQIPSNSLSIAQDPLLLSYPAQPFTDLFLAFRQWDSRLGCLRFRKIHRDLVRNDLLPPHSVQHDDVLQCGELGMNHVSVLVKRWTWIPDAMENLYGCRCGMSCLWTKSSLLVDKPDAVFFEGSSPPLQRRAGDPVRVYMDLEAGKRRTGNEDIFVSYHAEDDVQATYAGQVFRTNRNYHLSSTKSNATLVYWSSSRCLPHRDRIATSILSLLPHHSFGKCLNNVGGIDAAPSLYPDCINNPDQQPKWWDHLHCAMSHYKFVLAIENTVAESYVTEKLFYALDSGSVPIYFGAPNVEDFVPPHSIIDGSKFSSMEMLAAYVKSVGDNPVAYAEYHAWRRCGVVGNYRLARAASLDTLPCRLCEAVSRKNVNRS